MSQSVQVESLSTQSISYLEISGALDASFDADHLRVEITAPIVVLNLSKIATVDDAGAKKWSEAIAALSSQVERILFLDCSPAVVERLNRDKAFAGKGEVVSVMVDFACTVCARETRVLIDVDQPVTEETLTFSCAQCDSPLEAKIDPNTYFSFANDVPVSSIGTDVREVVIAFDNRGKRASIEPDSEEAEELRVAAEAIAAAEAQKETAEEAPAEASKAARKAEQAVDATVAKTEVDFAAPVAGSTARPVPDKKAKKGTVDAKTERTPVPARPAERTQSREPAPKPEGEPELELEASAPVGQASARSEEHEDAAQAVNPDGVPGHTRGNVTPPSIRTLASQQAQAVKEKLKPATADSRNERKTPTGADRGHRAVFRSPKNVLIAVLAGAVVILGLVVGLRGPSGVPPETIETFLEHLDTDHFVEAEAMLAEHAESLPEALRTRLETTLRARREAAATKLKADALAAMDAKDYGTALEVAQKAKAILPDDADITFTIGESLRQLGRLVEAAAFYKEFAERFAEDPRLDDALFWQAEAFLANSKLEEARALYTRVSAMDSSDFRTSSEKRLSDIASPPAADTTQ